MMKLLKQSLKSWVGLVVVSAAAIAISSVLYSVRAQSDDEERPDSGTTPYAEFQYATLTGTNNTINATMVPIVTSTGSVIYKDLTFQVNVSSSGAVTIVPGSPTAVTSPVMAASSFKAGTYAGPNFGAGNNFSGMLINVNGPGVVAGGFTNWTLSGAAGATAICPYPSTATWYVGAPSSTNNPLYARLKKAGITSTAYSYGTLGNVNCSDNGAHWYDGALIGVSQSGNAITISSFSYNGDADQSTPTDQITFTLKQ